MAYCSQCGNDVTGQETYPKCGDSVSAADAAPFKAPNPLVPAPGAPEIPSFARTLRLCFWEKYFDFETRASRTELFFFALWVAIGAFGTDFLLKAPFPYWSVPLFIFLLGLFRVYVFLPLLSVVTRRLHDAGLPGSIVVGLLASALTLSIVHSLFVADGPASLLGSPTIGVVPPTNDGVGGFFLLKYAVIWARLALLLGLVLFLCAPGVERPNKYGLAPVKRSKIGKGN